MTPTIKSRITIHCPGCADPIQIEPNQIGQALECNDCSARLNTRTDPGIIAWRNRRREEAKRNRAARKAYEKGVFEEAERRRYESDLRQREQQAEAFRKQREADEKERRDTRPVRLREIRFDAAVRLTVAVFVGVLAALLTHSLIVYILIQLSTPRYSL